MRRRLLFTTSLLALLTAGCSHSGQTAVPAILNGHETNGAAATARATAQYIDQGLPPSDQSVIQRTIEKMPPTVFNHLSTKTLILVARIDNGTVTTYSNRIGASKHMKFLYPASAHSDDVYRRADGSIFGAPPFQQLMPPRARGLRPEVVGIGVDSGTGPYRRTFRDLLGSTSNYAGQSVDVSLPCPTKVQSTDTPYVYLGGRGDVTPTIENYGFAVEAGLQYGVVSRTWAPYMRFAALPNGKNPYVLYDAADQKGATLPNGSYANRWDCAFAPETTQLTMQFYAHDRGTSSADDAVEFSYYTGSWDNAYSIIMDVDLAHADGYPWNGWSQTCNGCVQIQTASVAQRDPNNPARLADNFGDGTVFDTTSFYGSQLIVWSAPRLGSTNFAPWPSDSTCENYPEWTTTPPHGSAPNSECFSGPPIGALHNIIKTNFFGVTNEDVTIDLNQR